MSFSLIVVLTLPFLQTGKAAGQSHRACFDRAVKPTAKSCPVRTRFDKCCVVGMPVRCSRKDSQNANSGQFSAQFADLTVVFLRSIGGLLRIKSRVAHRKARYPRKVDLVQSTLVARSMS